MVGSISLMNEKYTIVDDCYNANPVSMKASIDVLAAAPGRKIAVLGDMGELGENEQELHAMVGEHFEGKGIDALFAAGALSENLAQAVGKCSKETEVHYFKTKDELMEELLPYVKSGDTVLVKASHFDGIPGGRRTAYKVRKCSENTKL